MEKINFSDLNLEVDTSTVEIEFNNIKLEILKYLPCTDKYDVIMTTLRESFEDGVFNPFKIDMFFHLNLVLAYCPTITYDKEDLNEATVLYDKFVCSNLMDKILETIDDNEYNILWETMNEIIAVQTQHNETLATQIINLIESIGPKIETTMETMKSIDLSQFKDVINFANAANGNRDINTNLEVDNNNKDNNIEI